MIARGTCADISVNQTDIIAVQRVYYNQNWSFVYQWMLVMSTQLIGFSIGGVNRRFLVDSPSMSMLTFRISNILCLRHSETCLLNLWWLEPAHTMLTRLLRFSLAGESCPLRSVQYAAFTAVRGYGSTRWYITWKIFRVCYPHCDRVL